MVRISPWMSTFPNLFVHLAWAFSFLIAGFCNVILNLKTVFPIYGILMLNIRRSRDSLTFNTGTPMLVRRHLYVEMALGHLGCFDGILVIRVNLWGNHLFVDALKGVSSFWPFPSPSCTIDISLIRVMIASANSFRSDSGHQNDKFQFISTLENLVDYFYSRYGRRGMV